MKIVAGLGNPGPQYETTRHNVGFLAVDRLIDRWNASGPVSKFNGSVYQANWQGTPILLVKPTTYMNLSGRCIGPIFNFYGCEADDLIVIHDELDLPPLTLRMKTGGGAGGHNGLKSIDEALGKDQNRYHRIRIGIGHPTTVPSVNPRTPPADYVLGPFKDQELQELDHLLNDVAEAAEAIFLGKIQDAMNKFHRRKQE